VYICVWSNDHGVSKYYWKKERRTLIDYFVAHKDWTCRGTYMTAVCRVHERIWCAVAGLNGLWHICDWVIWYMSECGMSHSNDECRMAHINYECGMWHIHDEGGMSHIDDECVMVHKDGTVVVHVRMRNVMCMNRLMCRSTYVNEACDVCEWIDVS